ncbi:hypothetical protein MLD38_013102 [Melastoma candidum]|uniref:Uncharacterized protein n=1 Tax=Melastoma candidum TaxID=119954 RepID=A0ACB9RGX3_9MYRT|nr:hypothetical protein MLD38_013102 [Melastoma candidum]
MEVEAEVERGISGKEDGGVSFPVWIPSRRRFHPDSAFFSSGNVERELLAKQVALDLSEDESLFFRNCIDAESRQVFCPIVGCGAKLPSLENFEDHYSARHMASCSVCSRVYPTSKLLSIHISEAHDSFFQAKVARGYSMYECLVEGCGIKFKNDKARKQHLVDKHKFPSSFEFYKKAHPSKKSRQRQQRKHGSIKEEVSSSAMEVEKEEIEDLVSQISRLSTSGSSPTSVSFGRRRGRGMTFVPRAVQRGMKSTPGQTKEGTG